MTSGKKAPSYLRFRGLEGRALVHRHVGQAAPSRTPGAIALEVADAFLGRVEVDQVLVISTRFLSAGTQVVETRQLLPLPIGTGGRGPRNRIESDRTQAQPSAVGAVWARHDSDGVPSGYTEFEPDGPRYSTSSSRGTSRPRCSRRCSRPPRASTPLASERWPRRPRTQTSSPRHSTRVMNRARQDAITTEIMEIVGGAEALRQGPEEE